MVEYVNNLEGTLTAKNEQLVAMKDMCTSFEKRLDTQSKEMSSDRKEFMKMMKDFAGKATTNDSANRNDGAKGGDRGRDRRRGGRERTPMKEQYCKNCKSDAYHIPKNCWELEENKAKRPDDWKSVLE